MSKKFDLSNTEFDPNDPANEVLVAAARRGEMAFMAELDKQVRLAEKSLCKIKERKPLPRRKPLWIAVKIAMDEMDFVSV